MKHDIGKSGVVIRIVAVADLSFYFIVDDSGFTRECIRYLACKGQILILPWTVRICQTSHVPASS